MNKIEIRKKKLEYLAGFSFDDEEWAWYEQNKNNLNAKAQARWDRAWRIAGERLSILEKLDSLYSSQEPQSVSTPTEGMELSEIEAREISLKVMADYAAWIGNNHPALAYKIGELEREISKATVAKVLSNLPTEQEIRESERKEIAKEILDEIEKHCTLYQWIEKPDFTKRHYPLCPTDFYELKAKYLQSGQSPKEV